MRFKHAEARELPQAAALGQLRFKHDCKLRSASQGLALRWLGASSLERARVSAVGEARGARALRVGSARGRGPGPGDAAGGARGPC